ncbi:HD domain-containing phosphohydrolase [Halomonas sp. 707D7]|uniref:HD domain-containing phosphohydrolase n=2 Tax=unclassified Halomonas TaxID=2609666 RepID=UPI00209CDA76|nr:HD domain-containing phosphohydrolase [Halomonas sp. 707D7]MCP1315395.1 PilZ domain-containing protein [Halomonas sp. 707D7]
MDAALADNVDIVEVLDERHIANVLAGLDDRRHALTVALNGHPPDYPAHLEALDVDGGECSLTLTDAGSIAVATLGRCSLTLNAENDQRLSFEGMTVLEAERQAQTLILRATLPRRLTTAARRTHARIALRRDMAVSAALTLYAEQPPIAARLCDISGGGCLVRLPLSECTPLTEGTALARMALLFPGGERFEAGASIRHITPVPYTSDVAVGLAFEGLDPARRQGLLHIVTATEREIAWRAGEGSRLAAPTKLYTAPRTQRSRRAGARRPRASRGVSTLREITRDLHLFLLALQNGQPLPLERLERSAGKLIKLLGKGRQAFFFGLTCLKEEPQWMQHSLSVAGKLADLMLAEPTLRDDVHRAVRAALIHDMGKALLIDATLPSLDSDMDASQRQRLRAHVATLSNALAVAGYPVEALERDIIGNINERLDGSGYPRGVTNEALSPLARLAAVVDVIDAMTRPRGDRPPLDAVAAYRYLYNRPTRFDQHWVTRYVQRHGFYPLGSLVEFSHGYLAWVLGVDERGQPDRVRVVRNLRRRDVFYDDEIGRVDFDQLGRLTGPAQPHRHDL